MSATWLMHRDSIDLHTVNVLEGNLELIDQQTFHLAGVHAAVVAEHEDLRLIDRRKDVDSHSGQSQSPACDERHDHHHRGDGMAHPEDDHVHKATLLT